MPSRLYPRDVINQVGVTCKRGKSRIKYVTSQSSPALYWTDRMNERVLGVSPDDEVGKAEKLVFWY